MTQSDDFINAVTKGEVDKVQSMLASDPSLAKSKDANGVSAILKAQYYGKQAVVEVLLKSGLELSIFEAAATGQTARVRELLQRDRALANAFAVDGFHPLGLAVFFRHKETAEVLLNTGADVNLASRESMKVAPINSAIAAGRLDIAEMLLLRGADPNHAAEGGFTPLDEATARKRDDLVNLLIKHGARKK